MDDIIDDGMIEGAELVRWLGDAGQKIGMLDLVKNTELRYSQFDDKYEPCISTLVDKGVIFAEGSLDEFNPKLSLTKKGQNLYDKIMS
tara:strand:- start:154 stop:417 length:264 start_codon:yes stop_codon:yes gene_type:complete